MKIWYAEMSLMKAQFFTDNLLIVTISAILILSGTFTIWGFDAKALPEPLENASLVIQKIADGFDKPSSFEFVNKEDILVTQEDGVVKLIRNFDLKRYPILDVDVSVQTEESSLSGITSVSHDNVTYVFLTYVQDSDIDGSTVIPYRNDEKIYRYVWDSAFLVLLNKTLVLNLPTIPKDGISKEGKVLVGSDNQMYTAVSNIDPGSMEKLQNGTVLRTTIDGLPLTEKGFERSYGIGFRGTAGMAFDPVMGYLWIIEEGADTLFTTDLIKPNSEKCLTEVGIRLSQNTSILCNVNGTRFADHNLEGSSPMSGLIFINSSLLGDEYVNDLVVGDNVGNLYHFDLDNKRENIILYDNLSSHLFATGFGPISDLKIGSDNSLYVLTSANNTGAMNTGSLYRIAKNSMNLPPESQAIAADYLWLTITIIVIIAIVLSLKFFKEMTKVVHMLSQKIIPHSMKGSGRGKSIR